MDKTGTKESCYRKITALLEKLIESCVHCNPEVAQIPFGNLLAGVTGSDPSVTDYILEELAKCPNCRREILEKTPIEPAQMEDHR